MCSLDLYACFIFDVIVSGNIPTIRKLDPIIQFAIQTLSRQYGNIFRLKMGPRWMLVVTGYDELKDILNHEHAIHRPLLKVMLAVVSHIS